MWLRDQKSGAICSEAEVSLCLTASSCVDTYFTVIAVLCQPRFNGVESRLNDDCRVTKVRRCRVVEAVSSGPCSAAKDVWSRAGRNSSPSSTLTSDHNNGLRERELAAVGYQICAAHDLVGSL